MTSFKGQIKQLLVVNQEKRYKKLVKSQNMDYSKWVNIVENSLKLDSSLYTINTKSLTIGTETKTNEGKNEKDDGKLAKNDSLCNLLKISEKNNSLNCETQYLVCEPKLLYKAFETLKDEKNKISYVILKIYDGEFSEDAFLKIHKEFSQNKNLIMIYSDEDTIGANGVRNNPYFKPDWSPDTFLSYFYFGGFLAIDAKVLAAVDLKDASNDIYHVIYKILLFNGAFDKHDDTRILHIPQVLFHTHEVSGYEYIKRMSLPNQIREKMDDVTVSVIIPSKDHPEILFRCIDTLIEKTILTDSVKMEIIVVDNGSSLQNKETISNFAREYAKIPKIDGFKYIYEPCEFNFSYMCNLGRSSSNGNFLLFLNDDMEIIEEDWLLKLVEKAHLPYAGAVGAKLIYPKSIRPEGDIIQHAGITNLRIGPAHKLQFLSDSLDHYFGANRYVHDMMGVTGACLLVKAQVFDEAGGFDEKLAVAFNDVDLCYKIYEKGYYNIVRNDVRLYHHESLSRGNDAESTKKQQRLNKEKDYLYEKHQELYGKDPFYNVNLTTDMLESEYAPRYHFEVDLDQEWCKTEDITDVIKHTKRDECVRVGMESAMDIYKWKYGVSKKIGKIVPTEDDKGFYFRGYNFVIGANNACYSRWLLMKNLSTERVYSLSVYNVLRPDIAKNLKDQVNVEMTGYTSKLRLDELPPGEYQFGMYMKDNTSTQRLYNWSNWTITIES